MNQSKKIDPYQSGQDAFAEYSKLPPLRFPLDENREHNAAKWESHLHVNPFPKNKIGSMKDMEGFREEWSRGWFDALYKSVYGQEETREEIQP